MIQLAWPIILIGIVVVCICYVKMREKIPTSQRDKLEKTLMVFLIIFLLINIGFEINQKRIITEEANDCIRFYRYFPGSSIDSEFYFIKEKCFKYFSEEEIEKLKVSGREFAKQRLANNSLNLYLGGNNGR